MNQIEMNQQSLFGDKVISSIGFDEQEIIRDILYLHAGGFYIDCDPCYSIGNFYKNGLPRPKYIYDKYPQSSDVIEATSDNLPLSDESVNTIMFDPPFVVSGDTYKDTEDGNCIVSKRFAALNSFDEIKEMYAKSLKEFYRILKTNGIVIFKCQDVVYHNKNHFTHSWVMNQAINIGYYPKDLFILLAQNRINDGRKQQHARKYHSYFWIFKKATCRVDYSLNLFLNET